VALTLATAAAAELGAPAWLWIAMLVVAALVAVYALVPTKRPAMSSEDEKVGVNVTSYNQSGGVTAHTVNVTSVPEAKVTYQVIAENSPGRSVQPTGPSAMLPDNWSELFVTQVEVALDAPFAPPVLRATIRSESLEGLSLGLTKSGMLASPQTHLDSRGGWTEISSPTPGTYILNAFTRRPENMDVSFSTRP